MDRVGILNVANIGRLAAKINVARIIICKKLLLKDDINIRNKAFTLLKNKIYFSRKGQLETKKVSMLVRLALSFLDDSSQIWQNITPLYCSL